MDRVLRQIAACGAVASAKGVKPLLIRFRQHIKSGVDWA
jgi:hypothetical protein